MTKTEKECRNIFSRTPRLASWLIKTSLLASLLLMSVGLAVAQEANYARHYIGILPSILFEPYDTVDAVEINIVPFVYEFRMPHNVAFQMRPIVNYRFLKSNPGISHTGASTLLNRYFPSLWGEEFWLVPQAAIFYTYAYNMLDAIHTMTLGIEPGLMIKVSDSFGVSLNIQGGVNYYPDAYSRQFVATESGFKPHLGIIVHFGFTIQ